MKKLIYSVFAATVMLSACTERIDLELNEDENQRLVVEGWFTNQMKEHEVRLTLTESYLYNQPTPKAEGAAVTITDEDNSMAS